MTTTYERHANAIGTGNITRASIIGLRKTFNAQARKSRGFSTGRTAPAVSPEEVDALEDAILALQPRVVGELHDSGLKLLQDRRYHKRFTPEQKNIIDALDHFRLVEFDWLDVFHVVPVYRAVARDGRHFTFRNVPWQSGGNGPEVLS